MSPRPPIGDPRRLGGDIAGPGGPNDRHGVIDTNQAVLMDSVDVALVDPVRNGQRSEGKPILAMKLDGRVNKSSDRAAVLYLFDEDGAAAIVTELVGLAVRIGPEFAKRIVDRLNDLPEPPDGSSAG